MKFSQKKKSKSNSSTLSLKSKKTSSSKQTRRRLRKSHSNSPFDIDIDEINALLSFKPPPSDSPPLFIRTSKYVSSPKKANLDKENKKKKETEKEKEKEMDKIREPNIVKRMAPILKQKLRNPPARTIEYLRKVCPDSSECIGFGEEITKISSIYGYYNQFKYIQRPHTKLISSGANGMAILLEYERDHYKSYAIMKTSLNQQSDNIFIDIANGYFINSLNLYYPCFMETYGMYRFKNADTLHQFQKSVISKDIEQLSRLDFYGSLIPTNYSLDLVSSTCRQPHLSAVLVQYINEPITLYKFLEKWITHHLVFTVELVYILYQVYAVLAEIAYDFTHYDLHMNNILLYKIPQDKYIIMRYYDIMDQVVEFPTQYIVKIIDYGRCFTPNMKILYDTICKTDPCTKEDPDKNRGCGYGNGYRFRIDSTRETHFITTDQKNVSHDLRLMHMIRTKYENIIRNFKSYLPHPEIEQHVMEIKQLFEDVYYEGYYGTPELLPGMVEDMSKIVNVFDMHFRLLHLVDNPIRKQLKHAMFKDKVFAGTMTIHLDKSKEIKFQRT